MADVVPVTPIEAAQPPVRPGGTSTLERLGTAPPPACPCPCKAAHLRPAEERRGVSVAQIAGPDRPDVVVLNGLSAEPREAARLGLARDLPVVDPTDDEATAVRYASVLCLPAATDTIAPEPARAIG